MPEITDLYVNTCLWLTQRTLSELAVALKSRLDQNTGWRCVVLEKHFAPKKPAGGVDIMAYRSLINIALFVFLTLAVHGQEENKRM
jgi:hypothetical protein